MSENLEPRPGDVWESPDGAIFFAHKSIEKQIVLVGEYGSTMLASEVKGWSGYTLLFRHGNRVPQPQPDGETVTVECAVMVSDIGKTVGVHGWSDRTAKETAAASGYPSIATVPVNVPVSLLSLPVLPTVNVSEQ